MVSGYKLRFKRLVLSNGIVCVEGNGRSGSGRRKRNNRGPGGSRRGSFSSEAGTPVPDRDVRGTSSTSRQDDYNYYQSTTPPRIVLLVDEDKPTKRVLGSGGYYQATGSSRSRHTSSPQSSTSRNGMILEENPVANAVSPTSTSRRPPSITSPTPPPSPGYRQSSEPPANPKFQGQAQKNSGRDQRREGLFDERSQDSYRSDGRPPSGRGGYSRNDRPSLPNKYDSLPPRFKKKYEEDRLLQSQPDRIPPTVVHPSVVETEWDGGSRTFVNISGAPAVRPSLPHPFPQSTPQLSSIRPHHQPQQHHRPGSGGGGKPIRGQGRHQQATGFAAKTLPLSDQAEDSDNVHVPIRPRSQDSMSFSDRERKTSVTDSRSSTPLSNVDSSSGLQSHLRGTLRRLEEVTATQTSLDWSEEMEEEDKRSLAGEQYRQAPPARLSDKAPEIVFDFTDIRYKNKPIQGYTVIPSAHSSTNGVDVDRQTGPTPPPMTGRPLLGQGRRQEVGKSGPPRMSVPGLIQLPIGPPPPMEQSRLSSSPRRSDFPAPSASSYDRSSIPRQQDHNRGGGDVTNRPYPRKTGPQQRTLFDPANPHKPIVVATRADDGQNSQQSAAASLLGCPEMTFLTLPADQSNVNSSSRPAWYDPQSEK